MVKEGLELFGHGSWEKLKTVGKGSLRIEDIEIKEGLKGICKERTVHKTEKNITTTSNEIYFGKLI